ncbi:hypothetical protein F511_39060 [Dorcoceras hygrometricum]|uniref:Uncharacterized protein n=1 Tax=Dorcoceras hygrometricum TaxID=472368 RepID=A0A2Z7B5S0_9LAMI|nr:hypothetical protein F511_39060 [Dorcoceras hygrometricum]
MRIRPPEIETSICDEKYHVSLSTGCVLGKWVCLVTLVMSLFDLQDVCIAIGSLATLDLPMVVDLIGIYVLKGPYCTLTMTNWFLQALSVIPRGSCFGNRVDRSDLIVDRNYDEATVMQMNRMFIYWTGPAPALTTLASKLQKPPPPSSQTSRTAAAHRCASAAPPPSVCRVIGLVSIIATRRFRPWQNPSDILVQIDGGRLIPVVDLIDDLPPPTV